MSPLSSSEAGQARVDGGQGLGRFADPGESTEPQPGGENLGRGDMVGAVPSASSAPVLGQRWPRESYGRARLHVSQVTMEILLGKLRATVLLHLFPFGITYVKQKVKAGRNHCVRECKAGAIDRPWEPKGSCLVFHPLVMGHVQVPVAHVHAGWREDCQC